jgi:hypothetical protein
MWAQPVLIVKYRWGGLCAILVEMQGVDVFCERCGTPQPKPEVAAPRSAGVLARRVLDAVGITENQPAPAEDWLRLCFSCRGYSCPACWNETAGVCQTCEPLPEPIVEVAPEPMPEPVVIDRVPELEIAPQPVFSAELESAPELEREAVDVLDTDPVFLAEVETAPESELELEPVAEAAPEAEPEREPVLAVEPEPAPVMSEPEPEPEPVERPRMPVLPLPPPRPADAPAIPLPPLPAYPVAPHIAFNPQVSVAASSQTSAPAYEAHLLLAPPPQLAANEIAAGLRPCPNCRLTLSARAHFCRRCGTAQPH